MVDLKDFKYKVIPNFITQEEINLLSKYCRIKHRTNLQHFDWAQNKVGDTFIYGDAVFERLMLTKLNKVQEISGYNLHPTYAFWRMYSKFSDLTPHTDRPSCEISVTVMIGSDGTPWPIYMEGEPVVMKPGDAVVYKGCEVKHWREEFEGDWQSQAFLHYVDAEGPNKHLIRDGRPFYGVLK